MESAMAIRVESLATGYHSAQVLGASDRRTFKFDFFNCFIYLFPITRINCSNQIYSLNGYYIYMNKQLPPTMRSHPPTHRMLFLSYIGHPIKDALVSPSTGYTLTEYNIP